MIRVKQIGSVLCLMVSLAIGHASACTCSHHERAKVQQDDCHSHHQKAAETVETSLDAPAFDGDCTCAVQQPSPSLASKSPSKQFKSNDRADDPKEVADIAFVAVASYREPTIRLANDPSYSHTLKALLPSRAPPRL